MNFQELFFASLFLNVIYSLYLGYIWSKEDRVRKNLVSYGVSEKNE